MFIDRKTHYEKKKKNYWDPIFFFMFLSLRINLSLNEKKVQGYLSDTQKILKEPIHNFQITSKNKAINHLKHIIL